MEDWSALGIAHVQYKVKLGLRGTSTTYMYLRPHSVQGHFGIMQCTCFKMPCNSKMAYHRTKQIEAWNSEEGGGDTCSKYWGNFDLVVFKAILVHPVHLHGIKEHCKK